jgi:hypothetical protein
VPPAAADLGNWRLPLLDTQLSHDQAATLASGAIAPWRDGARIWLSIPADLADGAAGIEPLSFTLIARRDPLSDTPGAPQVWQPVFTSDSGWTLSGDRERETGDRVVRQGDALYDQDTGLPWVPASFTLTAPDGTRYHLDPDGKLTRIDFTDGAAWLVSDAGIVAVSGRTAISCQFRTPKRGIC